MLSVVIATKNNAATLDECLRSVFSAEAPNGLEVIIVDAHSTDETHEILRRYPVSIYYDEKKGLSAARNIGWRNSRGEFILSLDADAYIEPSCLLEMVKEFEDPRVGIVECYPKAVVKTWLSRAQGQFWDADFPKYKASAMQEKKRGGGPVVMYRRELLEGLGGFDENEGMSDDTDLSYRAYKERWKITLLDERLAFHQPRHTLQGLMREKFWWGSELPQLWKKHPELYQHPIFGKYIPIVARLISPIVAIKWAIVFRNPTYLFFYPLMQFSHLAGCISGLLKYRVKKKKEIPR